jgi:hypothetical protein
MNFIAVNDFRLLAIMQLAGTPSLPAAMRAA